MDTEVLKPSHFKNYVEKEYSDGEIIVAEGDIDCEMFIIQEGGARVTKYVNDEEVVLTTLDRGEFFGEMSLLESLPRSATIRAVGKTRVQVIQPGGFLLKIRRDPTFAFEMLQRLSTRIRHINDVLVETLEQSGDARSDLRVQIEKSEYSAAYGDGQSGGTEE